ncbi:hypothetical protein BOTBODRAFT_182552 [Botryobasidium botryosum FD-172 SS1]|uniref:Uncharacterized protein n=1 Tax=Botryobasidium botryosum (strain FD-172 SS1) TaxID=930990 RepID=A0A067M0R5_BOTB1|nr:hypothetical protein BOTBODRAFT_182552 [Botryobasidium botryosum FD-172 SS1]
MLVVQTSGIGLTLTPIRSQSGLVSNMTKKANTNKWRREFDGAGPSMPPRDACTCGSASNFRIKASRFRFEMCFSNSPAVSQAEGSHMLGSDTAPADHQLHAHGSPMCDLAEMAMELASQPQAPEAHFPPTYLPPPPGLPVPVPIPA